MLQPVIGYWLPSNQGHALVRMHELHVYCCRWPCTGVQGAEGGAAAHLRKSVSAGIQALDRQALEECTAHAWMDGAACVAAWVVNDLAIVANLGELVLEKGHDIIFIFLSDQSCYGSLQSRMCMSMPNAKQINLADPLMLDVSSVNIIQGHSMLAMKKCCMSRLCKGLQLMRLCTNMYCRAYMSCFPLYCTDNWDWQ